MKLLHLFGEPPAQVAARQLYVHAVHQARRPEFYLHWNVPDTVDGRFDMIVLHVVLVMRRLKRDHDQAAETAQALFDLMFADMDQNLREMGVGDIGIGKRVKAMAKSFFGRLAAYDFALSAEDDFALHAALRRNLYRKWSPSDGDVTAMATYVRRESAKLEGLPIKVLLSGSFSFGGASLPKGQTNEQSV
ncbi:MAG: ubiquinol-cytochrome C chaperone family protein [Hyphomicrobium sp.]